jgi:hypothetical protein
MTDGPLRGPRASVSADRGLTLKLVSTQGNREIPGRTRRRGIARTREDLLLKSKHTEEAVALSAVPRMTDAEGMEARARRTYVRDRLAQFGQS